MMLVAAGFDAVEFEVLVGAASRTLPAEFSRQPNAFPSGPLFLILAQGCENSSARPKSQHRNIPGRNDNPNGLKFGSGGILNGREIQAREPPENFGCLPVISSCSLLFSVVSSEVKVGVRRL